MDLTAELVALVARTEPDPGPMPGVVYYSDQDYDDLVESLLQEHHPDLLWVFAYGSLIWKPEFPFVEQRRVVAKGWHRSFCIKLMRWRGTPEQPGLMMALDRGGSCSGVAYRLPEDAHRELLGKLVRREISAKPSTNAIRWIWADGEFERFRALTFIANPKGRAYTGGLPLDEVAHTLARAAGHWGSGAEYLFNTVSHLESFGIRDRNLWRLQKLVADEIRRLKGGVVGSGGNEM